MMSIARYALSFAIALLLAGCGGSQPTIGVTGANDASARPTLTNDDLLYVSEGITGGQVVMYSYPSDVELGTLSGFDVPAGLCTDASGDVFVTNVATSGSSDIVEFAHGATTATKTLSDPGMEPDGCAVSPVTGDLAVANYCKAGKTECVGRGNLVIYPKATGSPRFYKSDNVEHFSYCGYDSAGELYADGTGEVNHHQPFELVGLPRKRHALRSITVHWPFSTSTALESPGGIQWDGKVLAIGSVSVERLTPSFYRVNTSDWDVVSTLTLHRAYDVPQFFIHRHVLIAPNTGKKGGQILFYSYPKGVKSTKRIEGLTFPGAAVVSPGTSR